VGSSGLDFLRNKKAIEQGKVDGYSGPIILGGSFIIALVVMGLYLSHSQPKPPPTPAEIAAKQERSDEFDARIYAKEYVKKSLKAPSTANFQSPANFAVQHLKGGKENPNQDLWKVSGYVDAQNSFGAMIRNRFYIELVKLGDKWIPVKTVVGE